MRSDWILPHSSASLMVEHYIRLGLTHPSIGSAASLQWVGTLPLQGDGDDALAISSMYTSYPKTVFLREACRHLSSGAVCAKLRE